MDLEVYKQDEKQAVLEFELTADHDEIAVGYEKWLIDRKSDANNIFLDKIAEYAGVGGSCLDVGSSYGAQYFALKAMYPTIKYAGAEISPDYLAKFASRFKEGEKIPTIYSLIDYQDMADIPDGSYDVVTARSVLRHYTPEHGAKILDEMLRIATKAVVILFQAPVDLEEDNYTEIKGVWEGKGYAIEWSKANWEKYCDEKKVANPHPLVYIIEKV